MYHWKEDLLKGWGGGEGGITRVMYHWKEDLLKGWGGGEGGITRVMQLIAGFVAVS